MTREDRFWAKVAKADGDGCWTWTGQRKKGPFDYGRFEEKRDGVRRRIYAHRVAWELTNGPIRERKAVTPLP